ncbi:c-type cytochrome [Arenibacter sp. F20364]|uniref:c-type cytochrome n=1 Tax=Arenibacter sp. F20364 TaxID=2926415 RepID=UPI001FF1FE2B|nr:c-type cytochrome [Arenibacter sp. F20364]MCK0189233.1 c-type cytochrome [Arenibacter sp. F20364]
MKKIKFLITAYVFIFVVLSCSKDSKEDLVDAVITKDPTEQPIDEPEVEAPLIESSPLPDNPQRSGDAAKGYEYLIQGEYMSSGVPYDAFLLGTNENPDNRLNRSGDNANLPYDYTAITAPNGARVVAPNCMACHASSINNEFIIGLGSHDADFTVNRAANIALLNSGIRALYGGEESAEWQAYEQFRKSIIAIGPRTITETRGSNPADKITQVLIAYRDKSTLEWQDTPLVEIPDEVIPTDVPAWWLLKKKNAMFYHAIGRLDFCKSFIGSSLLTLGDASNAAEIDDNMRDVLAYIQSLEAPEYPFSIDSDLAQQGKQLFENTCATCHGTYGNTPSYPNLLVTLNSVGTDPTLSDHYTTSSPMNDYFMDWFNSGWFGTTSNNLQIKAEGGYTAPPLDGIWATAPYFHNGSVPTLEDVLNSTNRPTRWSRSFDNSDYDQLKVGWMYSTEPSKVDKNTYDTTLKGYGNSGHTFGDQFTDLERTAIIEYLKTL